jgi:hypothetical protein
MLDKRTAKFLSVLARICSDGSYKIIEKAELAKEVPADFTALNQMVSYLCDNEMVDVKYTDETVFCLTVLPHGRVTVETFRGGKNRETGIFTRKIVIVLIAGCFLAAVLGSLIGALIAKSF